MSPFPPPLPTAKTDAVSRISLGNTDSPGRPASAAGRSAQSPKTPKQTPVPAIPSNSIHIATSSIDGNVCVSSLVDTKDVMLRNFARPVQAVALSPDYKNDRTYLSGGLAGNLVMTVGGRAGTSSTSNTTGGAVSTASGWLGTIGLGSSSNGIDTVLHSGEGIISMIKWSLTGKYIVWVNEHGIKIMRSNLYLQSGETEICWKRISHIDRPHHPGWDEMAGVWKARAEWINENGLESEEEEPPLTDGTSTKDGETKPDPVDTEPPDPARRPNQAEKLVVGWGGTIWIVQVHPGGSSTGRELSEQRAGRAVVISM